MTSLLISFTTVLSSTLHRRARTRTLPLTVRSTSTSTPPSLRSMAIDDGLAADGGDEGDFFADVVPPPPWALSSILSSLALLYLSPVFVVLKSTRTPDLSTTPSNGDSGLRDGRTIAGVVSPVPLGMVVPPPS
jgi:hypothetical protein